MKREEAVSVLKELLDDSAGLDGHSLELTPPIAPTPAKDGYQIIIKGILDQETKQQIHQIINQHKLAIQTGNIWKTKYSVNKTEPDTLIIYKPKT